jgi:hypothetical protein
MKRILLIIALCLCSLSLQAQNKVYCEIIESNIIGRKVKVMIDFGQRREISSNARTLVDDQGEVLTFNSKIDALNFLDKLGWNFLQAYTVVNGSSGSTSSQIHWLLYKDVLEGQDPYEGLQTKAMVDKK